MTYQGYLRYKINAIKIASKRIQGKLNLLAPVITDDGKYIKPSRIQIQLEEHKSKLYGDYIDLHEQLMIIVYEGIKDRY